MISAAPPVNIVRALSNRASIAAGGKSLTRAAAVRVAGIDDAVEVAVGDRHTCARHADGTVACWGAGESGQLGNDAAADSGQPVAVLDLTDAIAIAAGATSTCARRSDGTVWCWGAGSEGQLGNGALSSSPRVVQVMGSPIRDIVRCSSGKDSRYSG